MIIKNAKSALLSNYEVLSLLKEKHEYQREQQIDNPELEYPEHLRTIQFELTGYLDKTPVSTQTAEQIKTFLEVMSKYPITLGERLQLLNLRPKSEVEVYLIIEECEERFTETEITDLVDKIKASLPRDDDDMEGAYMDGEEEEEEMDEDNE
ncbi:unnamed protein product [Cunninghamella blakesleeana]